MKKFAKEDKRLKNNIYKHLLTPMQVAGLLTKSAMLLTAKMLYILLEKSFMVEEENITNISNLQFSFPLKGDDG